MNDDKGLISDLLEHHRFYVNRNWQFFGGVLLINSIVLSSLDDFMKMRFLTVGICMMAIVMIGIFYHLINWTNMRIDLNMDNVNQLNRKVSIKPPTGFFTGMINWMKVGVLIMTTPHFMILLMQKSVFVWPAAILLLTVLIISEVNTSRFRKFYNELDIDLAKDE